MEPVIRQRTVRPSQQINKFLNLYINEYIEFIKKTLENEDFVRLARVLLPFDNAASAVLKIIDDNSPIKSMGITLVKMEMDEEKYLMGISFMIVNEEYKGPSDMIRFISAGYSIDEFKRHVRDDSFKNKVRKQFKCMIDDINVNKNK